MASRLQGAREGLQGNYLCNCTTKLEDKRCDILELNSVAILLETGIPGWE